VKLKGTEIKLVANRSEPFDPIIIEYLEERHRRGKRPMEVSGEVAHEMQGLDRLSSEYKGPILILIVDYGHEWPSEFSLRAIKNHQMVNLFEHFGQCD
jgi:hypothetical protein